MPRHADVETGVVPALVATRACLTVTQGRQPRTGPGMREQPPRVGRLLAKTVWVASTRGGHPRVWRFERWSSVVPFRSLPSCRADAPPRKLRSDARWSGPPLGRAAPPAHSVRRRTGYSCLPRLRHMEKYVCQSVIGKGTYGSATMARRKADGLVCIMKQIGLSRLSKREVRLVRQEAKLLATLRHPHIVSHLESFIWSSDRLCIVMEYCSGGDVEKWLERRRRRRLGVPTLDTVARLVAQTCMALEHVHSKRVVHRDVKCSNLFLSVDSLGYEMIKLGDFGISRVLHSSGELCATSIGTPCYMAPELLEERPYDYKVDVWSAGCVLYELASLKRAFEASSMAGLVHRVVYKPAPRLPGPLGELLKLMLSKRPLDRPDISDVLASDVLRQAQESSPLRPKRTTPRAPPRFLERAAKAEERALERARRARCLRQDRVASEARKPIRMPPDCEEFVDDNDDDDDDEEDEIEEEERNSEEYRALGGGWWLKRDPASHRWFYVHEATGHSQWEPPSPDTSRRQAQLALFVANGLDEASARRVRDAVRARVEESRREREAAANPSHPIDLPVDDVLQLQTPSQESPPAPPAETPDHEAQPPPMQPELDDAGLEEEEAQPVVESASHANDDKRAAWLGNLEARMGDLQSQLGALRQKPRRRKSPDADSPAVYVCELPVDQPEPSSTRSSRAAKRDASRAELRKRIAHDRRRTRKPELEVEILAPSQPPEPPPEPPSPVLPPRRKAVSLYEYLAANNKVDGLLRRASEPELPPEAGLAENGSKLLETLEIQRDDATVPERITVHNDDNDDDDEFVDCMTTLPDDDTGDDQQ